MIKVNGEYPSKIKFFEKKLTKKEQRPFVTFQIGERIKDTQGNSTDEWFNYQVTVFDDLTLTDGDEIKLTKIESLQARKEKSGKLRMDIVAQIDKEADAFDL